MDKEIVVDGLKFIPMSFNVDITVQAQPGDNNKGQISINDKPFILKGVRHQIIDGGIPIPFLMQDGLYRIDWSLYEQLRFWKGATPMADALFGSIRHGIWKDLEAPVGLPGNETLHVDIQNAVLRPAPFTVQVLFCGLQAK